MSELQERLRRRWPEILAKAKEMQEQCPDSVRAMQELFADVDIDDEAWQKIIEEPYG